MVILAGDYMIQVFDENNFLLFSTSDWFGVIDILLMQYYDPLNFNLTFDDNNINLNDKTLNVVYTENPSKRGDLNG